VKDTGCELDGPVADPGAEIETGGEAEGAFFAQVGIVLHDESLAADLRDVEIFVKDGRGE
jgi:hypothetical protein